MEVEPKSFRQDADRKAALRISSTSKDLREGLEIFNRHLSTAPQTQIKLEHLHHKDHAELEIHIEPISR